MELHIDRSLPITLIAQIKGQIAYAIANGMLGSGTPMPSVRELSAQLEVAPMTVTRVYRELAEEQLIVARPGVGTFVADITGMSLRQEIPGVARNLYQLVDACVQQALAQGCSPSQIRDAFLERLNRSSLSGSVSRVAIVGNFKPATDAYARAAEKILQDLNVKVETVLRGELYADLRGVLDRLKDIKLVIAIPTRLQEIRTLLEPHGFSVVAVSFQVSPETRLKVASIPPSARVGVVATYPDFLTSLLEGVVIYGLPQMHPVCAFIDQEEYVKEMLTQVDVVVYASGSEKILDWLPSDVEAFEYRHVPDPTSLNRLRPLMARHAVDGKERTTSEDGVVVQY